MMEYTFYPLFAKYVKNIVYGEDQPFKTTAHLIMQGMLFLFSYSTPTHDQNRSVTYEDGIRCNMLTSNATYKKFSQINALKRGSKQAHYFVTSNTLQDVEVVNVLHMAIILQIVELSGLVRHSKLTKLHKMACSYR